MVRPPPSSCGTPATWATSLSTTLDAIATGKIKGNPGDTFTAGKLGSYTIDKDGTVLLGKPTVFDKTNIDNFDF